MMIFRQLFDQDTSTLTYLLADAHTKEGLIIDPVLNQYETYSRILKSLSIQLKYSLETHIHADHISASRQLKDKLDAEVVVGAATKLQCADILIQNREYLYIGAHRIQAISTPGHTRGCTCYLLENRLFTGDTLLINGCGRTDFQQGDPDLLYDSLQTLLHLPDETLVYPGHDYEGRRVSSIGQEKGINPRISGQDKDSFITLMNHLDLDYPRQIDIALPANQNCGSQQN